MVAQIVDQRPDDQRQRQAGRRGEQAQQAPGEQRLEFHDVAAVVYYLRVIGDAIPHYNLNACAARLRAAHEAPQLWPVPIQMRNFLLIATKPR